MILAAGLGTRLRPLTDRVPKALIDVAGVTMIERVARALIEAGADRLVINLHHLGEAIRDFVRERNGFGVEVEFSEEPEGALETGGGVLHAAQHFSGDAPFFLHNVDILSDVPLAEMYREHEESRPLATLAVMKRESSRYLLFDEIGLYGRVDEGKGIRIAAREPVGVEEKLAFGGMHVIAADFPQMLTERGAFSILDAYLRLAAAGKRIVPFRIDGWQWIDIGKPQQLEEARARFAV